MKLTGSMQSIYEYPLYYDILFGWDRDAEADFYDRALHQHGVPAGGRIIEIGCGTGQVAVRLAKRDWHVTGLDLRPRMLAFLTQGAREVGVTITTVCADMRTFTLRLPQDGAYCPMSSFRVLPDDASVHAHLQAVAEALKSGSPYILDMGFDPPYGAGASDTEEWTMSRGPIEVRAVDGKIVVTDDANRSSLTLDWGGTLRAYTSTAFHELLNQSGVFSLEVCYPEFGQTAEGISRFDLQHTTPCPVSGRTMVVLRRVGSCGSGA